MKFGKKIKDSVNKEFDSEPLWKGKHLKAKTKSYNGRINTNFYSNKAPKEGTQIIYLSVILKLIILKCL